VGLELASDEAGGDGHAAVAVQNDVNMVRADGGSDWVSLSTYQVNYAYKEALAKHKSAHALALSAGLRSKLAGE
jgi:hypothetical protein